VPAWPFGIMTLKNRPISPAVQLFIECAREVAKPLAMLAPQQVMRTAMSRSGHEAKSSP
jgi:hypothetical protein